MYVNKSFCQLFGPTISKIFKEAMRDDGYKYLFQFKTLTIDTIKLYLFQFKTLTIDTIKLYPQKWHDDHKRAYLILASIASDNYEFIIEITKHMEHGPNDNLNYHYCSKLIAENIINSSIEKKIVGWIHIKLNYRLKSFPYRCN